MAALEKESAKSNHASFYAELEVKPEFKTVSALAEDLTPADALQQIQTLTNAAIAGSASVADGPQSILGNHLYDTACSVTEMAAQISEQHARSKLVDFVLQLQATTVKNPLHEDEPLKYEDEIVWSDLPTFGYTFADELGSFSAENPENDPRDSRRWENMTSFFAQLTALHDRTNFSNWAFIAFSSAFGPYDEYSPAPVNDRPVRAASLWLIHAGDKFWSSTGQASPSTGLEDWSRWKNGLADSKNKYTAEDTQRLISRALAKMDQVEVES